MIFNSVTFFIFIVLVVGLYWVLPNKARLWLIFISSVVFYGFWRWEYLSVMLASAATDYFTSIELGKTPLENKRKRNFLLGISLVVNLGLLMYFKYLFFFCDNANTVFDLMGIHVHFPLWKVLLPFGISFYTFETISYTVDVYRGLIKPEKDFIVYGSFITFFPKLVAGPIQRAAELVGQLRDRPSFQKDFLIEGFKRMLYGLFLKVVLADNISPLVDAAFDQPTATMSALDVWTMAFLFGFQIYFDFAGYSHIALGTAKLMGIDIPENFNFPYSAISFKDFWKRWHISLSSWIRDYLYLPLTGTKVLTTTGKGGIGESIEENAPTQKKRNMALFATWAIMGLWHGANWTFVFWGVYHATIIFSERKIKGWTKSWNIPYRPIVGWMITIPLAMLSWIPFRANTLTQTFQMLGKVINPSQYMALGMRENVYLITGLLFIFTTLTYLLTTYWQEKIDRITPLRYAVNITKYAAIIILVFVFLRPISQYIYFQF